jgi:hypothetical protein
MVPSIDDRGLDHASEYAIREPVETPEPMPGREDNSTADPYADMELRSRHERTEKVIRRARDLG